MLTLKTLRDNPQLVVDKLKIKNFDASAIVDKVLELDRKRRAMQTESDSLIAQQRQKAAEIGSLMKQGLRDAAEKVKADVAALKARSNELIAGMNEASEEMEKQLVLMPNLPCELIKPGKGAEDNEIVKMGGPEVKLPEGALPHWELAKKYDIIDFDLGVKITGAGFPVYKDKGAKLQRALINFFLDCNTAAGYKEVEPPVVVNKDSGFGTGQLPDKEGQMYHAEVDDFYLVPTAEVPVTNIFRDVILNQDQIPQKLTAYTPCFRREAGSYGKDVRGLNRLHQFDKVEMVKFAKPEQAYDELESMTEEAELILQKLNLPYRVITLCTGDMGFSAAKTYDLEVWLPSYNAYKEISSCSCCGDFQARRANIRYRDPKEFKGSRYLYTLNGSGLAVGRTMAAIIENYQNEDGTITVPDVLVPYMGGVKVIEPRR